MFGRIPRRTHNFRLFLVAGLVAFSGFLATPNVIRADSWAGTDEGRKSVPTPTTQATDGAKSNDTQPKDPGGTSSPCGFTGAVTDPVKCLLVPALNGLTTVMQWLASGAAVMFVWIVNPDNVSGANGLLNKGSLYELWKFIRDFFNLFFILILLLSAFATVFQVENFSIRKIFLNILIAALIINFSFPITRFLIDLTNVPMYYFLNAILPGVNGGDAFTRIFLASTGMGGISVVSQTEFIPAFTSFIFMFLFTISLLVLAVLFLVRVIALTLLLVFSPFGFAVTLMPGFQDLGRQWWSKFWNYALFGPAAALMLLVAMRFQNQLATDSTLAAFNRESTRMTAGESAGNSIALVAFYIIPLVLIWAAIGMANKFSIAGASTVTGLGYGAAKWAGKKFSGYNAAKRRVSAYMKEREKRGEAKFAATNIGTRLGQRLNAGLDKISAGRVGGKFETQAARVARNAAMERHKARVTAAQKEHMTGSLTDKDLVELHQRNKAGKARTVDQQALHAATTQEIAKRKIDKVQLSDGSTHQVTQATAAADLQQVKKNFGQMAGAKNDVTEETKKETAKAYGEAAFTDPTGKLDEAGFREAIRDGTVDSSKVSGVAVTRNFARLMAYEGKLNQQTVKTLKDNNPSIDMETVIGDALTDVAADRSAAMAVGPMSKVQQQQFDRTNTELNKDFVYVNGKFYASATDDDKNNVMKKSDHETFLKMAQDNKTEFDNEVVRLVEHGGSGKAVSILGKLAEEGRDIAQAVKNVNDARTPMTPATGGPPSPVAVASANAAELAYKRMENDYRFKAYT